METSNNFDGNFNRLMLTEIMSTMMLTPFTEIQYLVASMEFEEAIMQSLADGIEFMIVIIECFETQIM